MNMFIASPVIDVLHLRFHVLDTPLPGSKVLQYSYNNQPPQLPQTLVATMCFDMKPPICSTSTKCIYIPFSTRCVAKLRHMVYIKLSNALDTFWGLFIHVFSISCTNVIVIRVLSLLGVPVVAAYKTLFVKAPFYTVLFCIACLGELCNLFPSLVHHYHRMRA